MFNLIRLLNIEHEKSVVEPYITVSAGVFVALCGSSTDAEAIYKIADMALYEAKAGGRNRAVVIGETFDKYVISPDDDIVD
jgi:PleD family two-component response regulator